MYRVVFVIHLLGAIFFFILFAEVLISLFKNSVNRYKILSIQIALTTCFQLISGVILTLLSFQNVSVLGFCSKVGLYIFIACFAELILYKQIKINTKDFTFKRIISSR